ncbi:hypothetical protein AK830_g5774 [Neonectria ditissima]|uniref:Rho-GAP domain-containing protein n=1 Tax=Neonectria ditissima TaxID=78410 RepID=A0A0P7BID0_9HYPO|nr:hypothetical protein AK830_g5774 [Neonectria ditissima]
MDPSSLTDPPRRQSVATTIPSRRMLPSASSGSFSFPQTITVRNAPNQVPHMRSSRTWTTSSGERGLLSDTDELENRAAFVQEYNRLAKKHGVRVLVVEDFNLSQAVTGNGPDSPHSQKRGWFYRMLRSTSGQPTTDQRPQTLEGHRKRSVSDLAHNLAHPRRESPKTVDIQSMVRLSGKSVIYLPPEYAPSALVLPTCLRATAHYLAQNVATRGIFRIPGSVRVVNELFDYYCYTEKGGNDIASTVRCANLPMHMQLSVHDVASTFKRLLSVLPGGILGSLSIFDALVAIHSQLHGDPEFPRTKQTKVRARLIALAIATIESQFRRELICAVFGLLSLIGRVAEVAPREDDGGRPLPTGDLMGYSALGIVFGPLLLGNLLENYSTALPTPGSGLLHSPLSPPKPRRDRRKSKATGTRSATTPTLNKILVANDITEMLIVNWRDIVRQMKSLGMRYLREPSSLTSLRSDSLHQSTSEPFIIRKPADWDQGKVWLNQPRDEDEVNRSFHTGSPEPDAPNLGVRRQRPKKKKSSASNRLGARPSISVLSPTVEESPVDEEKFGTARPQPLTQSGVASNTNQISDFDSSLNDAHSSRVNGEGSWINLDRQEGLLQRDQSLDSNESHEHPDTLSTKKGRGNSRFGSPRVSIEDVPPRTSSKPRLQEGFTTWKQPLQYEEANSTAPNTEIQSIERRKAQRGRRAADEKHCKLHRNALRDDGLEGSKSSRAFSFTDQQDEKLAGIELQSNQGDLKEGAGTCHVTVIPYPGSSQRSSSLNTESQSSRDTTSHERRPPVQSSTRPIEKGKNTLTYDNKDTQHHGIVQIQDVASQGYICAAPIQFYAPMRVPPTLSGHAIQSDQVPSPSRSSVVEPSQRQSSDAKSPNKPPGRQSLSDVANKRGAVKAMAAMFEGEGPQLQELPNPDSKPRSRTQSLISHYSRASPEKSVQSLRSVSTRTHPSPRQPSTASQNQLGSRNASFDINQQVEAALSRNLSGSIHECIALREASPIVAEEQSGPLHDKPPVMLFRKPVPSRKPIPEAQRAKEASLQTPPSLGTMTPHQELPPIAQHLNRLRPSSSTSNIQHESEFFPSIPLSGSTPSSRPRSTTLLHAQIRSLQRQLDSRTEEAAMLRRQLEAQQNADVGTLSQQLREAKKEAQTWRERAEAAERRVKVFERFTARLRGLRGAAIAVDRQSDESSPTSDSTVHDGANGSRHDDGQTFSQNQQLTLSKTRQRSEAQESDTSGRTEDVGVITARIRKCLHGREGRTDRATDSPPVLPYFQDLLDGADDGKPQDARMRGPSQSAVEIWMAAQELFCLDDSQ